MGKILLYMLYSVKLIDCVNINNIGFKRYDVSQTSNVCLEHYDFCHQGKQRYDSINVHVCKSKVVNIHLS